MPTQPLNHYAAPTAGQRPGTAPPHVDVWGGNGRYAVKDVPESTDPDYTLGFSPQLEAGGSPDGSALPDDIRIGTREPPVRNRNDPKWQAYVDSEFLRRHSVEETEVNWHTKQARIPAPRMPIWEQERAPTRPTADLSPSNYTFQRPWHIPRNIKDALGEDAVTHFSMANHRRRYEIFGMKPQGRLGVNTYRAEPRPWDENLFVPPPAVNHVNGIAGNRSHRL